MFHGLQAFAQRRQSAAAPAAVAAIKWPLFNGDVCDFPAFVAKRKNIRSSCEFQLEYHRPCGNISGEMCVRPQRWQDLGLPGQLSKSPVWPWRKASRCTSL